jgi:CRISPR-associated protein Cmr4
MDLTLFIYTETSLHAGTGATVSVVDLPIQRERTTQYPLVQGSGVKGALRQTITHQLGEERKHEVEMVFGPDTNNGDDHAGAVSIGDARIVLFPVRSLMGVFAYITCPYVLARISRDVPNFPALSRKPSESQALVTKTTHVADSKQNGKVVLEEFSFDALDDSDVTSIANWFVNHALPNTPIYQYWRDNLPSKLVILPDNAFTDFVINSTEITTRVKIEPAKKTVKKGALWTQESLPADTLLMSKIVIYKSRNSVEVLPQQIADWLRDTNNLPERIQIGGDETTGQGFVALNIYPKVEAQS